LQNYKKATISLLISFLFMFRPLPEAGERTSLASRGRALPPGAPANKKHRMLTFQHPVPSGAEPARRVRAAVWAARSGDLLFLI
jgi:hypothetical protein